MIRYHDLQTENALDRIEAYIACHDLKSGDRLPSERELAKTLLLSRGTIREAFSELEREGHITRMPGKGTYLAPKKHRVAINTMQSFSAAENLAGNRPSSRLMSFLKKRPALPVKTALGLTSSSEIYELTRLRLVNGVPVILETTSLPAGLVPGLDAYDFESDSLYSVLERNYRLHIMDQELDIRLSRATDKEAACFDIEPGALVFVETGLTRDEKGHAIEYTKSILPCRSSEYLISIDRRQDVLLLDRDTLPVYCSREYPGLDPVEVLKKVRAQGRLTSFLYDRADTEICFFKTLPAVDFAFIDRNDLLAAVAEGHPSDSCQVISLSDDNLKIIEGDRTTFYRAQLTDVPTDAFRRAYLFGAVRDWNSDKCARYALSRFPAKNP